MTTTQLQTLTALRCRADDLMRGTRELIDSLDRDGLPGLTDEERYAAAQEWLRLLDAERAAHALRNAYDGTLDVATGRLTLEECTP